MYSTILFNYLFPSHDRVDVEVKIPRLNVVNTTLILLNESVNSSVSSASLTIPVIILSESDS